eukprot:463119-Pelagomonas_calceolata.AAC.2
MYPQACCSDEVSTIAKEVGPAGGLAGSGWTRTSGGLGGPLKLSSLISLKGHFPGALFHISSHASSFLSELGFKIWGRNSEVCQDFEPNVDRA